MTVEIGLLLLLLGTALVLFASERFPADVVALGVLIVLVITGLLPAEAAYAGFGSHTVMMFLGLLILTAALVRTGVVDLLGRYILRRSADSPNRVLAIIMATAMGLSTFMSNMATTAFFVPIVVGLAERLKLSPSRFLMPLAFAAILASSITLVATSTNIVVSGLLQGYDMPAMGMFELAPVGIPIALTGLVYMYFIGSRLIPQRIPAANSNGDLGARIFLTELIVTPNSTLVGKSLDQSGLNGDLDVSIIRITRDKTRHFAPRPDFRLEANDVLLVEGERDALLKAKQRSGIQIKAEVRVPAPDGTNHDHELVEVFVLPGTPLIGRTLKGVQFRERYGLRVLAVNRQGETIRRKLNQIRMTMGDVLLVEGPGANIALLEHDGIFSVLNRVEEPMLDLRRTHISISIFAAAIIVTTLGILPPSVAFLGGAVTAFVTRCITPDEAYRVIEWRVLIMVGSMLAFGTAMETTGAAGFLASQLVALTGGTDPTVLLGGFFLLAVVLTQVMSNAAAAAVIVPIAVQAALQLDLNPRTFAMMIAVAASCAYLTPLEPASMLVYGPGRYRFFDYLRVGALLTALVFVLALVLVPLVFPL